MKPTTKPKPKGSKEKGKPNPRRPPTKDTKPKSTKGGAGPKKDPKTKPKRRVAAKPRTGTMRKPAPTKNDKDSEKPNKPAIHTIKGETIKLNPLIFPEQLNPKPFTIKHTQEELLFAMACQEAVKVYKLDPNTSYKDPPVLLLNKYSEKFRKNPRLKRRKNPGDSKKLEIEANPPSLLLGSVKYQGNQLSISSLITPFKIGASEAKILGAVNPEIKGSNSFALKVERSCPDFRKTPLSPREFMTVVRQYISLVSPVKNRYKVRNPKKQTKIRYHPPTKVDGEFFRINLMNIMKTQMRVYDEKKLGERFSEEEFNLKYGQFLKDHADFSPYRLHDRNELKSKQDFTNQSHRYSDQVAYYAGLHRKLFIFIFNIKTSKLIKKMYFDFSDLNLEINPLSSYRPCMIDLAWDRDTDEALVSLTGGDGLKSWFKYYHFSDQDKIRHHNVSQKKVKKKENVEPLLEDQDQTPYIEDELIKFVDPDTGLLKQSCLINNAIEGQLLNKINLDFSWITNDFIQEEMIIDREKGISVVTTLNYLYLYDRKERKVYWRIPYQYEFLNGTFSGKIMAGSDTLTEKIKLFGVCEKTNQFDLIKEIDIRDKRLPQNILKKKVKFEEELSHARRIHKSMKMSHARRIHKSMKMSGSDFEELNPFTMIHFSYLETQGEYLIALVTHDPPKRHPELPGDMAQEDRLVVEKQRRDEHGARPQHLILFKLNQKLEIVKSMTHEYRMDRNIKISVSKERIVALHSIFGDSNNAGLRRSYSYIYMDSYELEFFDFESLEKRAISDNSGETSCKIKIDSPKISGYNNYIDSFTFAEPDLIVIESKNHHHNRKGGEPKAGRLEPRRENCDNDGLFYGRFRFEYQTWDYLQLRLEALKPPKEKIKENEAEGEADKQEDTFKEESDAKPKSGKKEKDDKPKVARGGRKPTGKPGRTRGTRAKPSTTNRRTNRAGNNRNSGARNNRGGKGAGPGGDSEPKKPTKRTRDLEKYKDKIKGAEFLNWEQQEEVRNLRVFKSGQDPFFCMLRANFIEKSGSLVLKYWDQNQKGFKPKKLEGYFENRKERFGRLVSVANLFSLRDGRVVIDEFHQANKYAFVILNLKNNEHKEFRIQARDLIPHRFLLWESKPQTAKQGESVVGERQGDEEGDDGGGRGESEEAGSSQQVIVADFDRFSNLVLMNFGSLF